MPRRHLLTLALLAALVAGCGDARPPRTDWIVERLYLGRDTPAGEVSEAEVTAFIDAEVTPRFPIGMTRIDAQGQWRGREGLIARERTVIIELVIPDMPDRRAAATAVADAWRRRFAQESVLVVETRAESVRF